MHELSRIVRVNSPSPGDSAHGRNGYGGKPAPAGIPRFYELEIVCRGEPDAQTGYLLDIKAIDAAARASIVPAIEAAIADGCAHTPSATLPRAAATLDNALPGLVSRIRWFPTPYSSMEVEMADLNRVLIRQRFDFAAAHRLHIEALSDEENVRMFGKCNNPKGHGHNYQVEPCIALATDAEPIPADEIERVTDEVIIQPFDHKHLNEDTAEFGAETGVNPTVENIARVFFERLSPAIAELSPHASLESITVWETDRTSATYPAP